MSQNITLRKYNPNDCAETIRLFYSTIHSVNKADYSEDQLNAWAPEELDFESWNSRFLRDYAIIAEKDGIIVGFGTLKETGYFDLLYVHKEYQRIGIATVIADKIEDYSLKNNINIIITDASITAKPFFENREYICLAEQAVEIRGQYLTNYKMQKMLHLI